MAGIVIRCDGSAAIGSGHVTRCRALAGALRERGLDVSFAMRPAGDAAVDAVRADGFRVADMPCSAGEWALGERDLAALALTAKAVRADCVLVDHYGADAEYLRRISDEGFLLAVIDDRGDRDLSAASWLLNQNLEPPRPEFGSDGEWEPLLGVEYALLRPQFSAARGRLTRRFAADDERLLLTLGGGATARACAAALAALDDVKRHLDIRCVLGTDAPDTGTVEVAAGRSRHDVTVLRSVDDMAALMAWADVSLNAGGSTCWELMCLGVPMIVTSLSPDQALNPKPLAAAGVAVAVASGDWGAAADGVESLLANPDRRARMSVRARARVDGRGAERAAASLEHLLTRHASAIGHVHG